MKVPNLGEAHCGEGARQSAQVVLMGICWRARSFEVSVFVNGEGEVRGEYFAFGFRVDFPHCAGGWW